MTRPMYPTPAHLRPTAALDCDHPAVIAFAQRFGGGLPPKDAAIALFFAVRDGLRYTPWRVRFEREAFRASDALLRDPEEGGHCIYKALLLAASARVLGIASRLHFANVRNHLGTGQLEAALGTDLLVFHGYVGLFLGGRWVSATPAFNRELCARLGVPPLGFDGQSDAVFQREDRGGGRLLEIVEDHGHYADLPYERMLRQWEIHYPALMATGRWPKPKGAPGPSQG